MSELHQLINYWLHCHMYQKKKKNLDAFISWHCLRLTNHDHVLSIYKRQLISRDNKRGFLVNVKLIMYLLLKAVSTTFLTELPLGS